MLETPIKTRTVMTKKKIIIGLSVAAFLIVSSVLLLLYPFASNKKVEYFSGDDPLIYKGEQQGNAKWLQDSVYVPFEFLQEQIDDTLVFDEKSNSIIITTKDKVIQMPTESLTYFVNEEAVNLQFAPLVDEDGTLYLALEPLLSIYPIVYTQLEGTGAIWIGLDGEVRQQGKISNENTDEEYLRLRTEASLQSAYVAQTKPDEPIFIEDEKEDYYFVRKEDGQAGYMAKKFVIKTDKTTIEVKQQTAEVASPTFTGPVNLTWEAVYSKNPDTSQIPAMDGVNVVSPTWFELKDATGAISNLASLDYTNWAKARGYQVWALFSNAFDPELTHEAFKDYETRQTMIRELLYYSELYGINGINIDIENVNEEDGPLVTQFVREATPYFHEAGLVVSMDITFIADGNYSAFFERDHLAEIVDYLVVMAYDEHWGSSPKAGSVASLPWVENNLKKLLELVPNEKLILGVPLYTRLWEVKDSGEVSSDAQSMTEIKEWLTTNQLTPIYDESTGQNYAELYVPEEATTYKVWLEDELSLIKRTELAVKYELAGVASWSRFFADETAWTALQTFNQQIANK